MSQLVEDFVGDFRMTGDGISIHGFQRRFLVVAVLEDPIVETRRYQFQGNFPGTLVFPKPAVDTGARRDECTVGLIFSNFIVDFVSLVIVRSLLA